MKDVLTYKGFVGSVHFSSDDKVFYGKIEGVDDLVTFESGDVDGLIKSFHTELDDYLGLCKELGKTPGKSYKGSFNVRVSPEIHKKAINRARLTGMTLNQFFQKALEKQVLC